MCSLETRPANANLISVKHHLLLLLPLLLLCACGSVQEHRARQMRAGLDLLTPEQRAAAISGSVEPGFTELMVYVALGHPRERSSTGARTTWIYYGWTDDTGHFRSTADTVFASTATLQQLEVTLRNGIVQSVVMAPLQWPPE